MYFFCSYFRALTAVIFVIICLYAIVYDRNTVVLVLYLDSEEEIRTLRHIDSSLFVVLCANVDILESLIQGKNILDCAIFAGNVLPYVNSVVAIKASTAFGISNIQSKLKDAVSLCQSSIQMQDGSAIVYLPKEKKNYATYILIRVLIISTMKYL